MIDRKFSCPAVSQICTLTDLLFVCTVPEANSQATVTWWCFLGFCSVKFNTMQDLPTPAHRQTTGLSHNHELEQVVEVVALHFFN